MRRILLQLEDKIFQRFKQDKLKLEIYLNKKLKWEDYFEYLQNEN